MTNIEMEVAHSTIRKNNAIVGKIETIDWEQRRYEIAKAILPTATQLVKETLLCGGKVEGSSGKTVMQVAAERAVWYADALIEELKNRNENDL